MILPTSDTNVEEFSVGFWAILVDDIKDGVRSFLCTQIRIWSA